jgi:GMP synthase-like glutamine amidotransferase
VTSQARPRLLVIQHQIDSGPGVIERPLRDAGIELDFWFPADGPPRPEPGAHDAYLSLGGLAEPDDDDGNPWLPDERALIGHALDAELPFLGVCLGGQLLAAVAGGRVLHDVPEHGFVSLHRCPPAADDPLFASVPEGHQVLQWHDIGFEAPPDAALLARSASSEQAFRVGRQAWGVQFHLEADLDVAAQWMVASRDKLIEEGLDPDALRDEAAARDEEVVRVARGVAERFAAVVTATTVGTGGGA